MKKILSLLFLFISVSLFSQQATLKTLSKPNYLDTLFLKNNATYMMNRNDSILFSKPIIGMTIVDSSKFATQQWTKNWVNNKAGYLTTATTIYIDSLGNDITGLGTLAKPYATLGKACKSVQNYYLTNGSTGQTNMLVFQFGKGTIAVPDSDWYALAKLEVMNSFWSTPYISFKGTYDTINTTTTWTAQASPNNYTYNAGNPVPTWTIDQYKNHFVKNGTIFQAIESNTANTANITSPLSQASMTGLYKLRTILQCATSTGGLNNLNLKSGLSMNAIYLKTNSSPATAFTFNFQMLISSCIIENQLLNGYYKFSSTSQCTFQMSVFRTNYSTSSPAFGGLDLFGSTYFVLNGIIIENYNASKNGTAVGIRQLNSTLTLGVLNTNFIKNFQYGVSCYCGNTIGNGAVFKDCSVSCYNIDNLGAGLKSFSRRLQNTNVFMIGTTSNLLYNANLGALDYEIGAIYGNTYNIWNASSTVKQFANALYNYNLKIPNTFPEYAQYQTATMANNTTDSIAIGNKTYTRSINITYNITRGTNYRNGTIRVLNTGTALVVDLGSYIETADLGVTLNGVYFGGTTLNDIKLKWTTTNTGTGATITYDVNRQNY